MSTLSSLIENPKSKIQNGAGRGHLLRYYFLISGLLIAGGLVTSGLVEIYFRLHETREHLAQLQKEAATTAAVKIEKFIQDVETAMRSAAKGLDLDRQSAADARFELKRLLFLAPAVSDAVLLAADGSERLWLSRLAVAATRREMTSVESPAFQQAKNGRTYIGPVYFVRGSEPFMTMAVPIEEFKGTVIGVLKAEVNLKNVWDVVSAIKPGKGGYAYAVTRSGELVAHPDILLVLQQRNVMELQQVRVAFGSPALDRGADLQTVSNLRGQAVISSFALIPRLDWAVFIERPAAEAYDALYASLLRTSALLLIGLGMAILASFFVARRVLRPLSVLGEGVSRIGRGDLGFRVNLKTGDEIETLAQEFNKMTTALQDAYLDLEQKVAERTRELTDANEKLAAASQHKSRFLANVNHELRTPVSAIIGYGGLVLSDTEGQISRLQKENLQDLLNNAERLLTLIDSLLDIVKIETGKMEVQFEPTDVAEIIRDATATIESTLNNDQIQVIEEVSTDLPVLNTDPDKLKEIILNLLDNAVKYTERGEIKISAWRHNGALKLTVSDTGIGIPKEDLNQVFEEFYRSRPPATKKIRGTGLGLAIVKRLVSLLGGNIDVISEVNVGSSFTVVLPFDSNMKTVA